MKPRKKIPRFASENGERSFWAKADSTDFVDWSRASTPAMTVLRPTLKTIYLRLPEPLIAELKLLANKRDVPYQSLLEMLLAERIETELRRIPRRRRKA